MDIAKLRDLQRSAKEELYCQFYSAYLVAEEDGDMERARQYRQQLRELGVLWEFSICDIVYLEAFVINKKARINEVLVKLVEGAEMDEVLEELESSTPSKILN